MHACTVKFIKKNNMFSEEVIPQTPVPDYEEVLSPQNKSAFQFATKFQKVISSIHEIGKQGHMVFYTTTLSTCT